MCRYIGKRWWWRRCVRACEFGAAPGPSYTEANVRAAANMDRLTEVLLDDEAERASGLGYLAGYSLIHAHVMPPLVVS